MFVEAGLGWITSPFHESSTIGWPHRLTILSIGVWHAKGKTLKISYTYFRHDIQIPDFNKSHRFIRNETRFQLYSALTLWYFENWSLVLNQYGDLWGPSNELLQKASNFRHLIEKISYTSRSRGCLFLIHAHIYKGRSRHSCQWMATAENYCHFSNNNCDEKDIEEESPIYQTRSDK